MEKLSCEIIKEDVPLPDMLFKVVIIGDAGVGKSCILYRATMGKFKEAYEVTIGAGFSSFSVRLQNKTIKLQIWDTAGQENFKSMVRVFYKGSNSAILVYDVNRRDTFDKLEEWLEEVKQNVRSNARLVLVGNQIDKEGKREVDTEMGKEFAKVHGIEYFLETSAKTGQGIEDLFTRISKELYIDNGGPIPYIEGKARLGLPSNKEKKGCCK